MALACKCLQRFKRIVAEQVSSVVRHTDKADEQTTMNHKESRMSPPDTHHPLTSTAEASSNVRESCQRVHNIAWNAERNSMVKRAEESEDSLKVQINIDNIKLVWE